MQVFTLDDLVTILEDLTPQPGGNGLRGNIIRKGAV
jgi:hypothetical protein